MFAYKVANTGKHKETKKKLGSSFRRKIFLSRIPLQTLFGEGASIIRNLSRSLVITLPAAGMTSSKPYSVL